MPKSKVLIEHSSLSYCFNQSKIETNNNGKSDYAIGPHEGHGRENKGSAKTRSSNKKQVLNLTTRKIMRKGIV